MVSAAVEEASTDAIAQHAVGGASLAEMLRRRRVVTKELSEAEVVSIVAGALSMKLETMRNPSAPKLHAREELWRYLCSVSKRRSEAVQTLHNLAAALEAMSSGSQAGAPTRINAFRSLTGIATAAGAVWPTPMADFYFLSLMAIFPAWGGKSKEQQAAALREPSLQVPVMQVLDALSYLVRDHHIRHRLLARVRGATAEELLTSTTRSSGNAIDVDWLLHVLMQSWEDSQLSCQKTLQQIFLQADDNGDGILQLDEFYGMIRERRPEMTDAEAFQIYDEALALSEQMLGYESDAILADAFVKTAMGHDLFSEIVQPMRTTADAAIEPPRGWGAAPPPLRGRTLSVAPGLNLASQLGAKLGPSGTGNSRAGGRLIAASASVPALPQAQAGRLGAIVLPKALS